MGGPDQFADFQGLSILSRRETPEQNQEGDQYQSARTLRRLCPNQTKSNLQTSLRLLLFQAIWDCYILGPGLVLRD